MPTKPAETGMLSRLLRVKQILGLSHRNRPEPSDQSTHGHLQRLAHDVAAPDNFDEIALNSRCMNCGYCQQGVRIACCPECGLPLATYYHDPTPWGCRHALPAWWATALKVWTWDRRVRLRTALLPATRGARQFALWSILVTAILASLAFAAGHTAQPGSSQLSAGLLAAVQFIEALVVISLGLLGVVHGLMLGTKRMWRRRYRFVPGSIYYATAWWPQIAGALLVLTALDCCFPGSGLLGLLVAASLIGFAQWGLWVWSSLFESECVSWPALRIGLVVLVFTLAGSLALQTIPGASQWTMSQMLAAGETGLARLQVSGSLAAGPRAPASKTYAVIIEAVPSDTRGLVLEAVDKMGAGQATRVVMYDADTKLSNIRLAFDALRGELRADDRLILYIGGHGEGEGAGAIRMADGFITSQLVSDLVHDVHTPHVLVVINSCFGGKFIQALRGESAVVLTSTDSRNVSFCCNLLPFWRALFKPESDLHGVGRVTVKDAFWGVYCNMLNEADKARLRWITYNPRDSRRFTEEGYGTPQLEVLGGANEDDFFVEVPKQPPARDAAP
jgi:hypothetical protein